MGIRRLIAFFIDIISFTIALQILALLPTRNLQELFGPASMAISLPGFAGIFFKDGIRGMSFGKWVTGIQVVNRNGLPIGFFESFKRNVSLIAWPIEAISILFSGNRITDKTLGNTVVLTKGRRKFAFRLGISLVVITFLLSIDIGQFYLKMLNEDSTLTMKNGLMSDLDLSEKIGNVKNIGLIKNVRVSGDSGHFVSVVKGGSGKYKVYSLVVREKGNWIYKNSRIIEWNKVLD